MKEEKKNNHSVTIYLILHFHFFEQVGHVWK